jgi:2,4-dienoyl-CoA reductase-like NADH-dependent reductase (Old Yellow Enzyme family)
MAHELSALFSPIRVGALTLKNRIYSSGHAEAMGENGRPGERLRRYHEAKARGGCALTIFGGSSSVKKNKKKKKMNNIYNNE